VGIFCTYVEYLYIYIMINTMMSLRKPNIVLMERSLDITQERDAEVMLYFGAQRVRYEYTGGSVLSVYLDKFGQDL